MGRLVLLICILNPREARDQDRKKPTAGRQVDSLELEQIVYSVFLHCPLFICDILSPLCNIYFLHFQSEELYGY